MPSSSAVEVGSGAARAGAWRRIGARLARHELVAGWPWLVPWVVVVAPVFPLARPLFEMFRAQASFPMDLEWMEGGQLYHAWRLAHGQPVYGPPSQGFVPFAYPPLHFVLLAVVGAVAGFGYLPARLLSIGAFLLAAGLLAREVFRHAERGPSRYALALLALGTLAATTPVVRGWYALVRNDSVAVALTVVAGALAVGARPRRARIVALAATLVAVVYTRQTGVFFVVFIVGFVLLRDRRRGLELGSATLLAGGALLALLEWRSQGWFLRYLLCQRHHPLLEQQVPAGLWEMFKAAPYLAVNPVLAAYLAGRRALSARSALWTGLFLAAFPAGLLPFAKAGGVANNYIPIVLLAGPAAILLGIDWTRLVARRAERRLALLAFAAPLGLHLNRVPFDLSPFTPSPSAAERAAALNAWVAALPGEVMTLNHPMLAVLNGKRTEQLHARAIRDAADGRIGGFGVAALLRRTRPDWVIAGRDFMELGVRTAVLRYYRPVRAVPTVVPMTIATRVSPTTLYAREPERRGLRVLFDFEGGGAPGWTLDGEAFRGGPAADVDAVLGVILGVDGHALLSSFAPGTGDAATGTAISPAFTLDRDVMSLLVSLGGAPRNRVELRVEPDRVVAAVQQARLEVLEEVRWDVRRWRGRRARLAIIDGSTEPGGRVMVDRVELFDP